MKYLTIIVFIIQCSSCSNTSSSKIDSKAFEVVENQELRKGVYWYFDKIKSADKNLLIIDNGTELIHLEISKEKAFKLNFDEKTSEGYILDKDGKGMAISSGVLEGILMNRELILSGRISGFNEESTALKAGDYTITFDKEKFKSSEE